ncbi:MAG: hypothetical protein QF535_07035, partial [Anaerolineales bacterium]|nr:hypothetical protein [Anaerolineales bacterium]
MAISRITASGVATDTLTAADLAPNSVDSSELVDGAVDLSHMSANSVDSDQYVDGSIDTAHLASNIAISTSGAITTTGAFTSVGIDDNADANAITIDSSENVGIGTATPDLGGASYAAAQTVTTISGSTNDQPGGILELNSAAANAYNSIQGEIVFTGSNQTAGHKRKSVIRG